MSRLCRKLGVRIAAVSKQSKHLDFNHPAMQALRSWMAKCTDTHQVDHRLICNFDQVWSTFYAGPRSTVYKHDSKRGVHVEPNHNRPSVQKLISSIRHALNLQDTDGVEGSEREVCKQVSLNAAGNLNPVDYHRESRTLTTLSWSGGSMGRAYITLTPGAM